MTLLVLADTRFPIERANGVQTMATCHALASRGHIVRLLVRPDTASPARDPFAYYGLPPVPGLTIETAGAALGGRARRARYLLAALKVALARRDVVVYTRDLGCASMLLKLPRGSRPPLVYESHGIGAVVAEEMPRLLGKPETTPSPDKLRRLDRRDARVWSRAESYVTITRALADDLAQRYGMRDRVFVVPDGASFDIGSAEPRTPAPGPRTTVAGYAGHLYPWKGVDIFVRAIALTRDLRALIVGGHPGEADRARVDRLIAELGLGDRVTVTGLVPPAEVLRRLAAASVLVLPNTASAISERYTSPLKLFEYLTLGRPIVASNLPAIREVLTDRETALLVPPGDPDALATALTRISTDPALAERLGRGARALAPDYTWARRAERLETALLEAERR